MTALTIADGFPQLKLTNRVEYFPRPLGQFAAPAVTPWVLPEIEKISVSSRVTYRLNAVEHDIFSDALSDSLQVRTTLRRE